ncbi:hypothetical protein PG991_005543 [Apiospora marii]|uniref:C2H2-type domain-containing protein n=1 Tax=Apiospora marii TaxID=335849 RepID=A0ABR1S9G8_9PEZI
MTSLAIVAVVSDRLFDGFLSTKNLLPLEGHHGSEVPNDTQITSYEKTPSTQRSEASQEISSSSARSAEQPYRNTQKRRRREEERSDGEGEDEEAPRDRRGPKQPRLDSDTSFRKLLACPFWKRDPRRHRDCFTLKLDGIPRVKQHLSRSHYSENHCERCKAIFWSNASRENHLRHEQCQWRGQDALEGLTHQQRHDLSRKSKPHHSESEKWFAIWEILFPGQPMPASAYMDPNLSEDLSEFRLYSQAHGTRILMEELEREGSSQELQPSERNEQLLRAALSRGQDLIFDAWLASRESPSSIPASSTNTQESGTPGQSIADSGVAMRSQEGSSATPGHLLNYDTRVPSMEELAAVALPHTDHPIGQATETSDTGFVGELYPTWEHHPNAFSGLDFDLGLSMDSWDFSFCN